MAIVPKERGSSRQFLQAALAQIADPKWLTLPILLLIFLGGTNAVLALDKPGPGEAPTAIFVMAGVARLAALVWISIAALRIATGSSRPAWRIDGAFVPYVLLSLFTLGVMAAASVLTRRMDGLTRTLITEAIALMLTAPLAVWSVAAAVQYPVAWSPVPWLQRLSIWFTDFLLWSLILVFPLVLLHAWSAGLMLAISGQPVFWVAAIMDGVLSSLLVLIMLSLKVAAYRSVARA